MTELAKAYDPTIVEQDLYRDWESSGIFHAEPDDAGEPFSIVIPPPNVTGSLHIGHALDNSIQDAIVRRKRMKGANTVWVPGMDHAGIATQNVVERQIAAEGLSRRELGREAFIERVWRWKEESGGAILQQLRRLGASCDWAREAFTFDEPRSRAVREVFVSLYEEGLIYRGNQLINWCPRCMTALSDIEVEHEETAGELVHVRYPSADGGDGVVVATTRPETMLGDTAVAVHPEDERYNDLVGSVLRLPLMEREIPVLADEHVDPAFGTGAVKVTPAHDPNDYRIAARHGLAMIDIMTDEGRISQAGGRFAGMDRYEARAAVRAELEQQGLLVKVEAHEHAVGTCSRCGTVVEPRLSDQWFVAVTPLATDAVRAVEEGRVRFVPARFTGPFLDWLRNLHDWCISRQIWWGHRIPAWYCPDGHVTVSRHTPETCNTCGSREIHQDEDVLDTWFSSALWPFTVLGWPDETPELKTWYPTSVLVTGYDINTFWVSRMLMMGVHCLADVPFHVVHNHGMVRDQYGKKMSKSFGNVVDPLDFIDRFGADALRFALFQHCAPGQDVPLAEEWVDGGRRFANKLWNMARFVLQAFDGARPQRLTTLTFLALEDRWILSRLEACRLEVDNAMSTDTLDWASAAQALHRFAWEEFADWYLEAAKVRLYGYDADARDTARTVLFVVLDDLLRLLHPLMPFVTEILWRSLTKAEGGANSLAIAGWPERRGERDPDAEERFATLQALVGALRSFRSDHTIPPSRRIDATVVSPQRQVLEPLAPLLSALAGLGRLTFADDTGDVAGAARVVSSSGDVFVPLAGAINVDEELARMRRELEKAVAEHDRATARLSDTRFVERAPTHVVEREREKRDEWARVIEALRGEIGEFETVGGLSGGRAAP